MRRRKLFTLAAGVSAVLCAGACALWVRSFWVGEEWDRDVPGGRVGVGSSHGQVWWVRSDFRRSTFNPYGPSGYHTYPAATDAWDTAPTSWSFAGFRWMNYYNSFGTLGPGPDVRAFTMPDWALVLVAGILPGRWLVTRMRRHRHGPGSCRACGYDLRATPDRCPECGSVPAAKGERA
jgi:hypothetical protein